MKPILMNINEMSDSREVYESKPNPLLSIFLYTVLGMLAIALIWLYFGRIDIVIKSEGMLRPNSQIATAINTYGGTLEEVFVEDGSLVKEGDILYVIEHSELVTQLDYYSGQLEDFERVLMLLSKYKESVENGVNYFNDDAEEEEYFIKTQSYLAKYKLAETNLAYNFNERKMNLASVTEKIAKLNEKLKCTVTLKTSVNANNNLFSSSSEEQEYINRYLKYQSDYNIINQKYLNIKTEIINNTTEEGLVNSLEYYNTTLQGLTTLKTSIENDMNIFEEENSYSLQYEEFINKIEDLDSAYQQAKENYKINKALEDLAVSEWDVQLSKIAMEEADRAIYAYKTSFMNSIIANITELEKNIEEITLNKVNTISKDDLLKQNEKDRAEALDNFQIQYIVELDNTINTLKDNIKSLELNKYNLELQGEKTIVDDKGMDINLLEFKNSELSTTINSINAYKDKAKELEASIDRLKKQIDSAVVKATMSGAVNSNIELVEGNYLQSGIEVLNIIPDHDSKYKVNIYVSNADIGKLQQGMKAKFNVYALPNSEYGYLTGRITSISKDLKVNNASDTAYYHVEAELDNQRLYNSKGVEADLKAGMACQAQMITESKRILIYLLEKIDLWMEL